MNRPPSTSCPDSVLTSFGVPRRGHIVRWLLAAAALLCLLVFGAWLALPLVPLPRGLSQPPTPSVEFLDRHGRSLREVRDGESGFARHVTYAEIPQPLIHATLAAEDKRFWQHPGVDWRATARAVWGLARHRRVISGGSTVTMQLIKLAEPRPRTFRTKVIEAAQALRLEQVWDKQRILTEYLNRLEYGNLNAGCAEAAEFFFSKPLRDLSVAECALLAGLPQAPSRLNPHLHFERAHKREQWILGQMRENGYLTADESARATRETLRLARPGRVFLAPHFVDLVMELEERRAEAEALMPDTGYEIPASGIQHPASSIEHPPAIPTTLDLDFNRVVERTLAARLARLRSQHVLNGAAVVIDNRSGDVLALVGSENYFAPRAGQVNGAWAPRSAGSAFKPFTYLLAFEHGANPATVVADVPTEFATSTGLFAPVNYNRHCQGPMRYRLALANSLNISAVKVLASLGGPEALQKRLQACGLTTLTNTAEFYGLGLTIGNAEARLLELANAYACLARLGEFKPYRLTVNSACFPAQRVCETGAAWLIADILSDNAARTLTFGAESNLRFDFPVACKTGTSSDFRDNWAFGYTPEFTVGVWVGNFDGRPMEHVSGVTGAAPILHELFEHLHARFGTTWYARPANVVERLVNPVTGHLFADTARADQKLPAVAPVLEKFLTQSLPPPEDARDYDLAGRVCLSSEYRDWLASGDNWLAGRAVLNEATTAATLRILSPLPGTVFYLDPDLPQSGRRLRLRANGPEGLHWQSDSLECRTERGEVVALLSEGRHHLVVQEPRSGARVETWILVKAL